jgi:Beta-lactamase associated winged helix domain
LARRSLRAHLDKLVNEGRARRDGETWARTVA